MSFTPNIPQIGQSLGNSRPQVLNNFSVLRTTVATNHEDVNDANAGKHTFIQYRVQGSDPATSANEIAEYTKMISGTARKVLRLPSNGAVFQTSGPEPLASQNGYTYLPGGLLMQWGLKTGIPTGGTSGVVFPIPFGNTPYSITVTGIRNNTGGDGIFVLTGGVNANGFILRNGSGTITQAYWMAIGPQ